jgi:hypothetical protein
MVVGAGGVGIGLSLFEPWAILNCRWRAVCRMRISPFDPLETGCVCHKSAIEPQSATRVLKKRANLKPLDNKVMSMELVISKH